MKAWAGSFETTALAENAGNVSPMVSMSGLQVCAAGCAVGCEDLYGAMPLIGQCRHGDARDNLRLSMALPLTLRQLEYVVAVADHRSFRKAATASAVTQPALSAQIAQVESLLG